MLREMIVMIAFITALSGITSGIILVQKLSARQRVQTERIMEYANEID